MTVEPTHDPKGGYPLRILNRKETGACLTKHQKLGAKLDPALKEFIDAAIVPVLLKKYRAFIKEEIDLRKNTPMLHTQSATWARRTQGK